MDKFITIKQFCERFNVSRSTIYRENKAGRLPFAKIRSSTRIRESVALAWQQSLDVSGRLQPDQ
jgi:excisionase family DNA binding protein